MWGMRDITLNRERHRIGGRLPATRFPPLLNRVFEPSVIWFAGR